MGPVPRVWIELFDDNAANHGVGTRRGFIYDALNVGWGWYSRFPANAFFTLRQDSDYNAMITPGLSHIRIWFSDEALGYGPILVFNGRIYDPDESGEDVVWTAWNYLAELALSDAGFRRLYPQAKLGTEVAQVEWNGNSSDWPNYGAKVQANSLLAHVANGTFEDPLDSGGSAVKTDNRFGVVKTSRLLLMFDMTEFGRANTDNNVVYEITRSITPTFNFWKNRGSAYTAQHLKFPGNIKDFRYVRGVRDIRNVLSTVGTSSSGNAVAISSTVSTGQYGTATFGRREDVFTIKTLAGARGSSESEMQQNITDRAVIEATQLTGALAVDVRPNQFLPYNGWDLEDTLRVRIKRGLTNIDADYRVIGVRGRMTGQGYQQTIFLQVPTA